jgi:hypothetical protein
VSATRLLGHAVEYLAATDSWRFADTGEKVTDEAIRARRCTACGERPTPDGHDPCIANLPGVRNACCGHGELWRAYVQFDDERATLRHDAALTYFAVRARGPAGETRAVA